MWHKCWFWRRAVGKMLAPLNSVTSFPQTWEVPESCPLSFCSEPLHPGEDVCSTNKWDICMTLMGEKLPKVKKDCSGLGVPGTWGMGLLSGAGPAGFQTQAIGATLLIVWWQMQRNSKDRCPKAWNIRKCNKKLDFCLPEVKLTQFRRKYAGILSLCSLSLSWLPASLFNLLCFFHLAHLVEIWTESEFKFLSGFCGIVCMVICLSDITSRLWNHLTMVSPCCHNENMYYNSAPLPSWWLQQNSHSWSPWLGKEWCIGWIF